MSKDITVPGSVQLAAMVEKVQRQALRATQKALMEAGEKDEDGNESDGALGDRPWSEAPIRVRLGAMLAAKAADHARETDVGHRQFGLLVLRERIKDHREWEKHAAEVDSGPAPTRTTTLDAEVIEPKKVEVK